MLEDSKEIKKYIVDKTVENDFVKLCGITVTRVECGSVTMEMPIVEKLANIYGIAHGGALVTLMDTAAGITCFTVGCKVVTLSLNTSFIKGAPVGERVQAVTEILHAGKTTLVVEVRVLNQEGVLLCQATGTFFTVGTASSVPRKW